MRRDVIAGGLAGLAGALALAVAALFADFRGLLGIEFSGAGIALQFGLAVPLGAALAALFRYQPGGYGALLANGLLFGLLAWVAGPLTLYPTVEGAGPTWSAAEATAIFPSLIGHLLFGGVTASAFLGLVVAQLRWRPALFMDSKAAPTPTRIVILGGGFGGISTAQRLEQLFWRDPSLEIVLLSQSNYLLFTPMLAEVAGSALQAQHISSPVRASLPRTRFLRCEVESIDTEARTVHARSGPAATESLVYDHLVLALGSVPNFFGLPGLEEHAFTLKSLDDATRLRNHVIGQLERADASTGAEERERLLTFAVAGGGFAGTELIAEVCDMVFSVVRYYPNVARDELRFVVVHSRDRILPELGEALAAYAQRKLEVRGIEFVLGDRVTGASADGMLLKEGGLLPAGTIVWTAGNQPNPILRELPCEKNRAGALIAEPTLQVGGLPNVWAVGDCAEVPDLDREGQTHPPTAQHAIREGKAAAKNIAAELAGKPLKPFRFRTIGMLVPLGHRTGVAEIRGLRFSGLLAWLMWRGIYLTLLPGLEKKVRVLFDWTLDLFFPRDIVLTTETTTPTVSEMIGQTTATPRPSAGGDGAA